MKLAYYKAPKGNFGDDLNPWLWEKLLDLSKMEEESYFLGIGSILHGSNKLINSIPANSKKIVFGTGIRPNHTPIAVDKTWDIKFLRGPLSSAYLGNGNPYISDAAYALCLTEEYDRLINLPKKHNISIMPYYRSCEIYDWEKISEQLGFNYISPLSEEGVLHTMEEIASSKFVITEAMHGAILADILRVPWHRFIFTTPFTEGSGIAEFKWMDWLQTIDMKQSSPSIVPFLNDKGLLNKALRKLGNNQLVINSFKKSNTRELLIDNLAEPKDYRLSTDSKIDTIKNQFHDQIESLRSTMS
ncbi:hypothetical protein GCM10007049_03740 [Echinicola pacifica]|uniref:Polysaccharide pyruvyl transferase domain-containing protein n=1 Tax=Echinicola pacifica TaxID=346377 RepID=A0A918PMM7_9BACT|nr:polysaccharide pyruvyl transferase family protein [Echinicola pacifica]GGZ14965.1 hypothetical protein GCM10007049_03740 [Echinicola pacifica]